MMLPLSEDEIHEVLNRTYNVEPPVDVHRIAAYLGVKVPEDREEAAKALAGSNADALLVPSFMFRAYANSERATVRNMAELFCVSEELMRRRAYKLIWPR